MRFRALLVIVVLAVVGYGAFWYSLSQQSERQLTAAIRELREAGYDVVHGDVAVSGFPYRLVVEIAEPALAGRNADVRWEVSAERLRILAQPWRPIHRIIVADNATAALAQTGTGRDLTPTTLAAPLVRASFNEREDTGARLSVVLEKIAIDGLAGHRWLAAAGQFHLRLPPRSAGGSDGLLAPEIADIAVDVTDIDASDAGSPLGDRIARVAAAFDLHGTTAPAWTQTRLAQWRDTGGTVEIRDAVLTWGGAFIKANGSLSLDEALRPLGALTAEVRRPHLIVDHLRDQGRIDGRTADVARETFKALQASVGDDKPLSLPITLQDGDALVGPIPLVRIGPVLGPPRQGSGLD